MVHVTTAYGTRPEAIKMAPIILALERHRSFTVDIVVTGQHREMLEQVHDTFGITPTHDLDIHSHGQTLTDITSRTLTGLAPILADRRPDMMLVQGDTTSTLAAAMAAFYAGIPVAHAEAGLRTRNRYSPFPEEINRRMTSQIAALHLAPTARSRRNLIDNGIDAAEIVVTGNSVIDALLWTTALPVTYSDAALRERLDTDRPVVLVTAHRRESWGEPMRRIGHALSVLAARYPHYDFVFPMHRNPLVREAIMPPVARQQNVVLIEPLPYEEFCQLMKRATIVLTDSGGVQEEAPSLGKPVLVMRENTERPEAVEAGVARLVGTDPSAIVSAVAQLIEDPQEYAAMAEAVNPYGDGSAARRTVAALLHHHGQGPAADPFVADRQRTPAGARRGSELAPSRPVVPV